MEKMRSKNEVFIDQQAVEMMSESGLYVLAGWFRKATEETSALGDCPVHVGAE
jgi:anti-anti-sigma regulatory factor